MTSFNESSSDTTKNSIETDRLHGTVEDVERAGEFAEKEQWSQALAIVDSILALPDDKEEAVNRIDAIMQDDSPVTVEDRGRGRLEDGRETLNIGIGLGGGLLPALMAMRGQYLANSIAAMFARHDGHGPSVMKDEEFDTLIPKSLTHANVVTLSLQNFPDPMAEAGRICLYCAQEEAAERVFEHVLQIDPNNAVAASALPLARQAIAAAGK